MSWSFSACGKPAAVLKYLQETQSKQQYLNQPEEIIRTNIHNAIEAALRNASPHVPIEISASGSQSVPSADRPEMTVNSVRFEMRPLWTFLE